jgi:hypothetical protein
MTTKEKAKDLVGKYVSLTDGWVYGIKNWEHKKKCALIAVDEILNVVWNVPIDVEYWEEVKKEIEKL